MTELLSAIFCGQSRFAQANGCSSMKSFRVLLACFSCLLPINAIAQSAEDPAPVVSLELNAADDVDGACRLTFLVENRSGTPIGEAVFETVIFDSSGGVVSLTLFNFRDLPLDRPRVRRFGLSGMSCASVSRVLINGANSCVVNGAQSDICQSSLSLNSRLEMELLG